MNVSQNSPVYSDEKERVIATQNFIISGYNDYIAGRFLLLNDYTIQGVTLASSAVEKYLKAMLAALGVKIKLIHMDKLDEIEKLFIGTAYETIFQYFDTAFLEILSNAYTWRYFNDFAEIKTIRGFVNQIIGELDFTISLFERLFTIHNPPGVIWISPYKKAIAEQDKNLFVNNYVLNCWNKQYFMMSKSQAFVQYFDPNTKELITGKFQESSNVPYYGSVYHVNAEVK